MSLSIYFQYSLSMWGGTVCFIHMYILNGKVISEQLALSVRPLTQTSLSTAEYKGTLYLAVDKDLRVETSCIIF